MRKLTEKQKLAATLRGEGVTQAETGQAVGASDRTIRRWEEYPEFQQAMAARLAENAKACRRLAFRRVRAEIDNPDPAVALKAADLALKHTAAESEADTPELHIGLVQLVLDGPEEDEAASGSDSDAD